MKQAAFKTTSSSQCCLDMATAIAQSAKLITNVTARSVAKSQQKLSTPPTKLCLEERKRACKEADFLCCKTGSWVMVKEAGIQIAIFPGLSWDQVVLSPHSCWLLTLALQQDTPLLAKGRLKKQWKKMGEVSDASWTRGMGESWSRAD